MGHTASVGYLPAYRICFTIITNHQAHRAHCSLSELRIRWSRWCLFGYRTYHVASFIFIAFVYLFYITFLNAKRSNVAPKIARSMTDHVLLLVPQRTVVAGCSDLDRIIYTGCLSFYSFFSSSAVESSFFSGGESKSFEGDYKIALLLVLREMQLSDARLTSRHQLLQSETRTHVTSKYLEGRFT